MRCVGVVGGADGGLGGAAGVAGGAGDLGCGGRQLGGRHGDGVHVLRGDVARRRDTSSARACALAALASTSVGVGDELVGERVERSGDLAELVTAVGVEPGVGVRAVTRGDLVHVPAQLVERLEHRTCDDERCGADHDQRRRRAASRASTSRRPPRSSASAVIRAASSVAWAVASSTAARWVANCSSRAISAASSAAWSRASAAGSTVVVRSSMYPVPVPLTVARYSPLLGVREARSPSARSARGTARCCARSPPWRTGCPRHPRRRRPTADRVRRSSPRAGRSRAARGRRRSGPARSARSRAAADPHRVERGQRDDGEHDQRREREGDHDGQPNCHLDVVEGDAATRSDLRGRCRGRVRDCPYTPIVQADS